MRLFRLLVPMSKRSFLVLCVDANGYGAIVYECHLHVCAEFAGAHRTAEGGGKRRTMIKSSWASLQIYKFFFRVQKIWRYKNLSPYLRYKELFDIKSCIEYFDE